MWINAMPEYGIPPYSIAYSGLPLGCHSSQVVPFDCVPEAPGKFNVSAWVNDSANVSVSSTVQLTVFSLPSITAFRASKTWIDLKDTTSFQISVTGGAPALNYTYSNLPAGCAFASGPNASCTPTAAGDYAVSVEVTDALGASVNSSIVHLHVQPDPRVTSLTVSPSETAIGLPVQVNVTTTGGTAPITFNWSGIPQDCSASGPSFACIPVAPGSYQIVVNATDSLGHSAIARANLSVTAPTTPGGPNPVPLLVVGVVLAAVAVIATSIGVLRWRGTRRDSGGETKDTDNATAVDSGPTEQY